MNSNSKLFAVIRPLVTVGGLFLPWLLLAANPPPPAVKLAVVQPDPSADALADGLMVELSREEGVTLLERAELSQIAREQGLGAMDSASVLKTGALMGADGLVVLDTRKLSWGVDINMRLVGVRRGVSLGWWSSRVDEGQVLSWSQGAVAQLRTLLPKIKLDGNSSAALSFVGMTAPTVSLDSTELERAVNSLFLERLAAEPDLLVLEREQLLETSFEKLLSADDRKFWNGAYLVQGALNPEHISGDTVSIRYTLAAPGLGNTKELSLTGRRSQLAALAQQFVIQVKQAVRPGGKEAVTTVWDAPAEAKRFGEQAENAVRWGFWPEARRAVDTALALGQEDLKTRVLRVRAYTGSFRIDPSVSMTRECRPKFALLEQYSAAPKPEALGLALDTAYQLRDLARSGVDLRQEPLRSAIAEAVDDLGWITFRYYMGAELRTGNEEKLQGLRNAMVDFVEALLKQPDNAGAFSAALVKFGPLWCETPEQGVAVLRKLGPRAGVVLNLRFGSESSDESSGTDWTPKLFGWKWADRSRVDEVWEAYCKTPIATPPVTPRSPSTESLPAEELLQKLALAVTNKTLPAQSVIRQVSALNNRTDRQRAYALLQELRQFPPQAASPMALTEVHRQIALLNAQQSAAGSARDDAILRTNGLRPQASSLRFPAELKPVTLAHMRGFAGQRPPGASPALAASVITLTNGTWRTPYTVGWAEGKLWVFFEAASMRNYVTANGAFGTGKIAQYVIAAFDGTKCVETNAIPERYLSAREGKESIGTAVFPDRILFLLEQGIVSCGRKTKTVALTPSPIKSPRALARNDTLFLYNEESILATTAALREFKVLASVRRRPALTPVDSLETLTNPYLFQAGGHLMLAVGDQTFILTDDRWSRVEGRCPVQRADVSEGFPIDYLMDEVVLRQETSVAGSPTQAVTAWYYGTRSAQPEPWWSNVAPRSGEPSPVLYPHVPDAAPFYFPAGRLVGITRQAAFPFAGQLLTLVLGQTSETPAQIQFWRTNSAQPISIPVTFPGREQSATVGYRIVLAGNRLYLWKGDKLWYLEAGSIFSEVSRLLSVEEMSDAEARQYVRQALAGYDRNRNGKLDQDEYPALADEAALFDLAWQEMDGNHNNILNGPELVFFDFDRDGKLNQTEHRAFLNAVAYYAGTLYTLLDKNGDHLLEESETRSYCGAYLLTLPGSFQKHDRAKTGKLGLEDWTRLVAELLDARLVSGFEGRAFVSAAGRTEILEPQSLERFLTAKDNAK